MVRKNMLSWSYLSIICRILIVLIFAVGSISATIIRVPDDYPKVQEAIDAASSGDTVSVASGRYAPSTNEEAFPINMKNGVRLHGAGANACTLDAENTNRVVYCNYISNTSSEIKDFTITNGTGVTQGGGIFCNNSSLFIANNIISANSVSEHGGGIWLHSNSSPTLTNNIITSNSSGWFGGGISCFDNCSPIITNNVITGNTAVSGGGGGINCHYTSLPTITNNVITGNTAVQYGGGITCFFSSDPIITNNIVTENSGGDGGIYAYNSSPTINYDDVWNNTPQDYYGCSAGIGCISDDPLFMNPGVGDYHLQTSSPCIDTGDNDAPELPEFDFDGNPRIIDGNDDGVAVVDMGPFEHPEIIGLKEVQINNLMSTVFGVAPNIPNPFTNQTKICYNLPRETEVKITIYNVLGEKVIDIFKGIQAAGLYSIHWNGEDKGTKKCPSGIYFYRVETEDDVEIKKMMLIKQ